MLQRKPLKNNTSWYWSAAAAACRTAAGAGRTESTQTLLKNCPLFCPKCKRESLINAVKLQVTLCKDKTG
ncbi:hypothetical protein D7X87_01815 [bacterium D16-54]|nr:hypothetical protein D7X87_01815 [bacterium D16-54]RKJ17022.1 hypothetical protein D7X65_01815 [bacterium D16-56]